MVEDLKEDIYNRLRRSIKKVRSVANLIAVPSTFDIMELLTIDEGDIFSKALFWKKRYKQECIEIKNTIYTVTNQLKHLTRKECCDKMCIEQDLLGGCKTCPYGQYCTTAYGETVR